VATFINRYKVKHNIHEQNDESIWNKTNGKKEKPKDETLHDGDVPK